MMKFLKVLSFPFLIHQILHVSSTYNLRGSIHDVKDRMLFDRFSSSISGSVWKDIQWNHAHVTNENIIPESKMVCLGQLQIFN
jgi:hypothetical protein